ncbi:MAG: pyruvoyl-dependent arginine decarboxylase [Halobacteriaceae archaeon]
MGTIHVASGAGTGPTAMASYDAALADAGVENYNLVAVSSVVPADAEVRTVAEAPDLGPVGGRLTVVEARATVAGPGSAGAALGWSRTPSGEGLFYESGGVGGTEANPDAQAAERVRNGLAAGLDLRDWDGDDPTVETQRAVASDGHHATAVVVAAYGEADPIC